MNPRFAGAVVLLGIVHGGAHAEDVVVLQSKSGRGKIRSVGEILDFTGRQLVLRHSSGREESIETSRVLDVQSTWTKSHQAADQHFAQAQFTEAFRAYRQALSEEQREWVRRRILARCVWCLQYLDQTEQAIDAFITLYNGDRTTQYFEAIPLAWLTRAPAPAVERRCALLLGDRSSEAGQLIGASWLLPTSQRAKATAVLKELSNSSDARIAYLADAQLWRTQTATATAEEVTRWQARIDRMPAELQAGPTFILAQTLARLKRPQEAALALMRIPILHPLQRELASHSLLAAGQQLEATQDLESAHRLYQEVLEQHPKSTAAAEAQRRIAELEKDNR